MISTTATTHQKIQVLAFPGMAVDLGGLMRTFSDEDFLDFCRHNPDARIERERDGEIIIMPPAFSETGGMNMSLSMIIGIWARKDGTGRAFDSSTGFTLPNRALRSPDASWISNERWSHLSDEDRAGFARACPDFVVELRSQSDTIRKLRSKMTEYIDNGALLGWLIDPLERRVHIYRPDAEGEVLQNSAEISGDLVLRGFTLELEEVWG